MSLIANTNRDPKKRARPFTAEDFLPRWSPPEPQSPAQTLATAEAITLAFGGTVTRKEAPEWRTSLIS